MRESITTAQQNYIVKMLPIIGKQKYHELKTQLGIERTLPIPRLSKNDAARLIRLMILAKNRTRRAEGVSRC